MTITPKPKAYLGIKYHSDQRNRSQIEGISRALGQCGFETVCIVRDIEDWGRLSFTPQILMKKTFEVIDNSQFTVIDLSEKGVGLGLEAGYAYAQGIPLITIARTGADISTTLRGISKTVFLYDDFDHLTKFFEESLL